MIKNFKELASRIRSLREDSGVPPEEMAQFLNITPKQYASYESGTADIPASIMSEIAVRLKVDLGLLLKGETPKSSVFSITRKGKGVEVEQSHSYRFENFSASFKHAQFEPFIVTQPLASQESPPVRHSHPGQEFNYLLEGKMRFSINEDAFTLEAGDSIMFDSSFPHSIEAVDGDVKFLAVITA